MAFRLVRTPEDYRRWLERLRLRWVDEQRRQFPSWKRRWWGVVLERDEYACVQCGASGAQARLVPDHIIPLCQGGETSVDNIRALCWRCNSRKAHGDKTGAAVLRGER